MNAPLPTDLVAKLEDLIKQATTERSHYYVAATAGEAVRELKKLRAALQPFAKGANHGEEISIVFRDAGYDAMACRDAFMWQAMKPLCVRDFLDARSALEKPNG